TIVDFVGGLGQAWRLHPLLCIHHLSLLALLLVYPFVIAFHVVEGELSQLAMLHLVVIGALAVVYRRARSTRALPPWLRIHPISFLPMAVLMPVAYVLLTPLGLFRFDTAGWDTRGQVPGVPR
ncbi:MAG TPA: hypothetical protein VFU21_25980, partial [Kofleriaceae bacterium]|nr:hypothetical protein [Kofleriaceae bacterium]